MNFCLCASLFSNSCEGYTTRKVTLSELTETDFATFYEYFNLETEQGMIFIMTLFMFEQVKICVLL